MSTQLTRVLSPSVAVAIAAVLALAACNRESPQATQAAGATAAASPTQLAWARAALERNPELEVIATDPQSGVVTVKHRASGEIQTVKASEVTAALPSQLKAMTMQPAPPPEPEPGPAQEESASAPSRAAQAR